jgi:hypothetical protein
MRMVANMENDSFRHEVAGPQRLPSPSEAREILSDLSVDGSTLSQRVVTPWWYHLILGIIVAMLVGSQALPVAVSGVLLALGLVAIPVLTITYARRYGLSISQPAGPRSRRLLLTTLGILVLSMIANLTIKFIGAIPWWGLIPAAIAFTATLLLGRRYDDALRNEIAGNGNKSR